MFEYNLDSARLTDRHKNWNDNVFGHGDNFSAKNIRNSCFYYVMFYAILWHITLIHTYIENCLSKNLYKVLSLKKL